ncbi:interleukin-20 receptor subunit beta isoform X2 [Camelus ferus]|uniref:Interleukin-20 receptor subunit beta isoform X2 n=2 Tax=Camelus TaxID=9836 RepID=A0A8B8TP65_CAMFR|nr:interleukin-20 receptor subunit beta isoform X2 [Camelus ferus]XP_045367150.1 interleukin-20 receptor subunit beta isoform X2 [Camelus bactrianus]
MVLEEISTSLIMWFSYALIPCLLIDAVAVLPAPQNLSVQSTNMKHVLTWSPVVVPEEIIHYSVEYQGEYESLYMSHIWIPSSWCSPTAGPECDITDDITATVPYNLRVRATLGSQTSAWSTLKQPFNRNSTILTPPEMEVTQDGFHLVIKLEDLGPQFEYFVAYWRKESGAEEHVKMVRNGGVPVHLETMEPGSAFCVKAQTFVKAIGRHSAFSQAECVKVQENNQFTPEVNQLQKGGGRSLCNGRTVFQGAPRGLHLAGWGWGPAEAGNCGLRDTGASRGKSLLLFSSMSKGQEKSLPCSCPRSNCLRQGRVAAGALSAGQEM